MNNYFKKKFHVSDFGAEGLKKATNSSFIVDILNMLCVFILMYLGSDIFKENFINKEYYFVISFFVSALLYIGLYIQYDRLYTATYKESKNLRVDISKKLSKLPLEYFSKHNLSDLSQSIMKDVETLEHAMSHAIPVTFGLVFFLPIIGLLMLIGNVKLGFAVIIPQICRLIILFLFKDKIIKGNSKYYGVLRENSEAFQQAIEMNKEIKAYNLKNDLKEELYNKMEKSEEIHYKNEKTPILILSLSGILSFVSLGICLIIGTNLLINGEINLLYFIGYLLAAMKIKDLVDVSNEVILEVLYAEPRIEKIKEIKENVEQCGEDYNLKSFDIDIKNICYSYTDDKIIDDVSFVAKNNKVTAIVGPSGCGKTTMLKLITRLLDVDEGEILIDGKNIKKISTDSLFAKVSMVFQDVVLFNGSIFENIRIGRLSATDEEVKNAAILANCMEFIEKMPKGFDSLIGENGSELSGGERQRISIARAFLKDAPILILDEISSSLDVENERKIQESINKLIKNKTVVVVSHRLKSIEKVDKIVLMDKGKILEEGSHEELLEKSDLYRDLIDKSKMAEEFEY